MLQWVAVCCSVLQCVAACRSVLQCVAVCCIVPLWCIQTFPRCTGHLTRQIVCSFAWQRNFPKSDIWEFSRISIVHVLYGKSSSELIFENSFLPFCGRERFKNLALCLLYILYHLRWHSRMQARKSLLPRSFASFQWKETFELWVLSFETAFENVTAGGMRCK